MDEYIKRTYLIFLGKHRPSIERTMKWVSADPSYTDMTAFIHSYSAKRNKFRRLWRWMNNIGRTKLNE